MDFILHEGGDDSVAKLIEDRDLFAESDLLADLCGEVARLSTAADAVNASCLAEFSDTDTYGDIGDDEVVELTIRSRAEVIGQVRFSTLRALTPTNAASPLARLLAEARNEVLEEAEALRDVIADEIGARPMSSIHSALSEYRNRIRALKGAAP